MATKEQQFRNRMAQDIETEIIRRMEESTSKLKQVSSKMHTRAQAAETELSVMKGLLDGKKQECKVLKGQLEDITREVREGRVTIGALKDRLVKLTVKSEGKVSRGAD